MRLLFAFLKVGERFRISRQLVFTLARLTVTGATVDYILAHCTEIEPA